MTKFFDMNMLKGRTGLAENGISWQMVSAIRVANTNENIGTHNSVKTRGLAKDKDKVIGGWTCRILHIAAGKAANVLQKHQDLTLKTIVFIFFIGLTNYENESSY